GAEPERRALLADLSKRVKAPEVRFEVALELADSYPENADLLHEQLKSPLDKRRDLFRALAWRGLAEDVVRGCEGDALLAADAREVLLARDARPDKKHTPELAKALARQGFSRRAGLAFHQDFSKEQDWDLVLELMKLLDDPELRDGAHLMLLSVSDKDLPPDKEIWFSWVTSKRGAYKPPLVSDPGPVTAAILRARAALQKLVQDDGVATWPQNPDWPGTRVGATALSVLALRAAGLKPDDPAIQKALRTLLVWPAKGEPSMRDDLDGYTYALSLLAMALESVDRSGMKQAKEAICRQLCEGQLPNGQWTYNCRRPGYGDRPATGDNSNTQFAILGLRSLRRCGVPIEEDVIKKTRDFWIMAVNAYGGWGYGPKGSFHHEMSMTAAGISTLAICTEVLRGNEAVKEVLKHDQVVLGQRRLGELLLNDGFKSQEIYTLYGVERACILTRTRAFNDFDWYREGADILVRSQKESGAWGDDAARGVAMGQGYGEEVDTSFALLFLKRATTGLVGADESDTVVKVPEPRRPSKPK
ncbi:MAG: prenyltransferase/squalene oxidase repeat-containing protein, partial [Planctomycetota bacterium]